jgi:hypothetical protein
VLGLELGLSRKELAAEKADDVGRGEGADGVIE